MEVIQAAGLSVFIYSKAVERGLEWRSELDPGLWFGTMLKGSIAVERNPLGEGIWRAGNCARFQSDEVTESHHTAINDGEISSVFIRVSPETVSLIADGENPQSFAQRVGKTFNEDNRTTSFAQALAWQMVGCTLTGASRHCYLAGKAFEMIAHMVRSDDMPERSKTNIIGECERIWAPKDVERLHQARDILLGQLDAPPAIPDLAREVGLNIRKLGRGFVDLFGEPVYGFVKSRRLEEARLMLEAGETSVAQVAYAFGYQPGHFSTEFRKRFGISPGTLTGRRGTSGSSLS